MPTAYSHLPFLIWSERVFKMISPTIFSGTEVGLTDLLFSHILLSCPSWKQNWNFLSSSPQKPPNNSNLSKIIRSGITMTSFSSLSTHGCIPSGLMDLSNLFKCSPTWSSSIKSKFYLLQTFPLISEMWDSWRPVLSVKTKMKALWVPLSFPRSSGFLPHLTVVPSLPFAAVEAHLVALNIPFETQLPMDFSFPNSITAHLYSVSTFTVGHLTWVTNPVWV